MPTNAVQIVYHQGQIVVADGDGKGIFCLSPNAGYLLAQQLINAIRQGWGKDPIDFQEMTRFINKDGVQQ